VMYHSYDVIKLLSKKLHVVIECSSLFPRYKNYLSNQPRNTRVLVENRIAHFYGLSCINYYFRISVWFV